MIENIYFCWECSHCMFFRDWKTMRKKVCFEISLLVIFLCAPLCFAAKLTREDMKCLDGVGYYPGAGSEFTVQAADDFAYLNVDMARLEFIGEYDAVKTINYCAYDLIVDRAAERNIKILGLLDYQTIDWQSNTDWGTDDFRIKFVNRIKDIVSHYNSRPNRIRHWEIWNEPDLSLPEFNVRIEPEPYGKILVHAWLAIKDIDSSSTIVFGGISPKGFEYTSNYLSDVYASSAVKDFYKEKGKYPFDVVACHPYPETFTNPNYGLASVLQQKIKNIMNANGDEHKRVWLTEMGWSASQVTEKRQSDYLTSSYHIADTLKDPGYPEDPPFVEKYFWFAYKDFSAVDLWGLYTADGSRQKQSYTAYLNLTDPGPEPPVEPPVGGGEFSPVPGTSDDALPFEVSDDDLLEAMEAAVLAGGVHPSAVGGYASLTNGLFDSSDFTLVLQDYARPSLKIRYSFDPSVDLTELRVFGGHATDTGNRAFQSVDFYVNGALAKSELNAGVYKQAAPGEAAVSLIRWLPDTGKSHIAMDVETLDVEFWCVSSINGGFRDRWSFCGDGNKDQDGYDAAYVASIIKEIDAFGSTHQENNPNLWMLY